MKMKNTVICDGVICSQTAYKEAKERVLEAYGDYSIDSLLTLFSELQRIAANMPAKNEAVERIFFLVCSGS